MNDSKSFAQGSKCYEQIKGVADIDDFGSWAQGSRWYEQLTVLDYMNVFDLLA